MARDFHQEALGGSRRRAEPDLRFIAEHEDLLDDAIEGVIRSPTRRAIYAVQYNLTRADAPRDRLSRIKRTCRRLAGQTAFSPAKTGRTIQRIERRLADVLDGRTIPPERSHFS